MEQSSNMFVEGTRPLDVGGLFVLILGVFGLLVIVGVYIRIYLVARRHENQIAQVQRFARTEEIANVASVVKSAFGIFYAYLLFLICYLPSFIGMVVYQIYGPSIPLKKVFFSWTLLNLNSSLNALIYCWKMTHIRHAILNILRYMSWLRNAEMHGWPCYAVFLRFECCHSKLTPIAMF